MAKQLDASHANQQYTRFSVPQRIEHIILLVSFATLGLTGLIQKFATVALAAGLIDLLGGIEAVRIIHRIAAITFALQSVYHIAVLAYKIFVQRVEMTMLPGLKDIIDAIDVVRHNLGLTKEHPKMPRYNFAEKAEYWALIWGGIVMGLTGFMLWNPIATAKFLPGQIIPAAKAAHGGEAILAVLAIIVWHFYSVHIKTFNKAMFTGKLNRHQMEEEHGHELERLTAGTTRRAQDPVAVSRRQRIFVPIAVGIGLVLGFAVIWFATFEESAIATLPAPVTQVPVFAPLPVTPVPTSTVENNEIGAPIPHGIVGQEKCDTCHGLGAINPYPTNHEGRPNESCSVCHEPGPTPEPGAAAPSGGSGQPKAIPHPIEGDQYKDCTVCHGTGKLKPSPENHASFTTESCTMCHQPAAASSGSQPAAAGPKAIPHPIDGDAYKDCTMCHGAGKLKPSPENHASFTPESCTTCHQPAAASSGTTETASATAIPHGIDAEAYKDCTLCHGAGKVKPFPENHASFAGDSCLTCHKPKQ